MKKYNNNWDAKKLTVNFNHKQWRQDIGAYIKEKLNWNLAVVSRSKAIDNKGTKIFEITNEVNKIFKVQYVDQCNIEYADNLELVNDYLKERL